MVRYHLSLFSIAGLLCALIGLVPLHADAEHLAGRKTLKGLQGVTVVVEQLSREAEQDGLHRLVLQTEVETRLRRARIRVLTLAEALATPGGPTLYVNVQAVSDGSGAYAVMLRLELIQAVSLARDPATVVPATTWHSSGVIGGIEAKEVGTLQQEAGRQADEFINAYRSMNPRM